jgi:hypothetical protein
MKTNQKPGPGPKAGSCTAPGTNEWAYETRNYMDPEPDWNAGSPYVDHAHGVVFYDEASEVEAGRERWPSYRHVGPQSEPEPETEAGLWRSSPWGSGTG